MLLLTFVLLTQAAGKEYATEHYDLWVETLDEKDVGAMLEQLHHHLSNFFGKAPDRRLKVGIYSTRDRWADALRADREHVIAGAGGYTSIMNGKVYAYLQPSDYFTRHVILHEATHQFHYAVATGNNHPSAYWYQEGFAEYFGMHNWDGKVLKVGVVPAITLEDYPAQALKNFGGDLERLVGCKVPADRPEGWALVHFLIHQRPKECKAYFRCLDRREDPLESWKKILGPITAEHGKEFRAWIDSNQQPWRVAWIGWQQRGDALLGTAQTVGIATLKTARKFRVEIQSNPENFRAGVVFGFQSTEDFYLLQLYPGRRYRILRRKSGGWEILVDKEFAKSETPDVVEVNPEKDRVTLSLNGESVGDYSVGGQVGLNIETCSAHFRIKE